MKKTAQWGLETAADNKMVTMQNYCAGHKVLKNAARMNVSKGNKSQNGNKTELVSQRGKSKRSKINNMNTRGNGK